MLEPDSRFLYVSVSISNRDRHCFFCSRSSKSKGFLTVCACRMPLCRDWLGRRALKPLQQKSWSRFAVGLLSKQLYPSLLEGAGGPFRIRRPCLSQRCLVRGPISEGMMQFRNLEITAKATIRQLVSGSGVLLHSRVDVLNKHFEPGTVTSTPKTAMLQYPCMGSGQRHCEY